MKEKNILVFNDLAGYGKVALSAMIPLFSHFGIEVVSLPTALVSNTLDYGKFEILDTSNYIQNTLKVYDELGFSFNAIATGFITSLNEAKIIYEFCQKEKGKGTKIYVDPIMGDNGKLYNGVDDKRVECMKLLASISDLIMPNMTEACFIARKSMGKTDLNEEELQELMLELSKICAGDIVVTSMKVNGKTSTVIKRKEEANYQLIPYDEIPARFPGTGDIFSSILISGLMQGKDLYSSVVKAMNDVRNLINKSLENKDKFKGIPIELYLNEV